MGVGEPAETEARPGTLVFLRNQFPTVFLQPVANSTYRLPKDVRHGHRAVAPPFRSWEGNNSDPSSFD